MAAVICRSVIDHWASTGCLIDQSVMPSSEASDVKLTDFVAWLEKIGTSTKSDICWKTGGGYDFSLRGEIGEAITSSRTLGTALNKLTEYFPLIQDGSTLTLDVNPDWSSLSYKILDPDIWPRHHDALYSLGIYASLIKIAAPEVWNNIDMAFEAPAHLFNCDLSRIVNARCQFEGISNTIFFPSEILNRRLAISPTVPQAVLSDLSNRLIMKKRQTPMKTRVKNLIMLSLNEGAVYQEDIASKLGVTSRTLRRHLTASGVSFQDLLDESRMQLVTLEFKSRRNVSLSEMAFKLGYSEHSTFSRAFARWTGLTPQEYREALSS